MNKNPNRLRLIGDNSIANLTVQGQQLLASSSDSAKLDVEILLSLVLKKSRSYLLTWPEKKLSDEQLLEFIHLLSRRAQGEPIAYITGIKEFWSLPFAVSEATLIPRPDTETLVELVLELYSDNKLTTCLDLGTGTGAIALALASEKATWEIDATDFNIEAVKLAQRNAKNLNLAQVHIYQSDWFEGISKNKKFDIIVSNPPYIDGDDINLSQGDVRFEPKSALVASEQGLADIKHIADKARCFLNTDGKLFFEHGFEQGYAVRTILTNLGYKNAQTKQDLNGHERISWAIYHRL
ncbi:peptide chain release factor N(5)-glutamine methyltransferase [Candidatus Colwellia aromaticivorans]|uniref:peptide chain release factor N(5)-glutamine methyltransferase n=1 Tax=Candidatus Colwellia aromaticivorans TaxID=2267621 RepID=UPI003CCC8BBB